MFNNDHSLPCLVLNYSSCFIFVFAPFYTVVLTFIVIVTSIIRGIVPFSLGILLCIQSLHAQTLRLHLYPGLLFRRRLQ